MNGHYSQERVVVGQAYPGKKWVQKVMAMSDEQVHEIYVSIMFRRENEENQRKAKEKARKSVKVVYTDYGVACGSCGFLLQGGDQNFCPQCGAEVDWK